MAGFQKFQFDNFIIDENNQQYLPQQKETLPKEPETIEAEIIMPDSEQELIPEAEVEEIISYTEEDVVAKERLAEERGYERGFKTSQEGLEAQNNRLLEEINNRLLMLAATIKEKEQQLENQSLQLIREAVLKLVPTVEKENAVTVVSEFLDKNFKNFKQEVKLSFYFNPELVKPMQETIARLANSNDFEGKISLHKDASLDMADCRIEWENGGLERSGEKTLKKIDEIFSSNMHSLNNEQ